MRLKAQIKFLVDESVEFRIVKYLRRQGYKVIAVAENFPTKSDKKILNYAYKNNFVLITNDKDFSRLVFKENLPHRGVIFLRIMPGENLDNKIKILNKFLRKYKLKLKNNFFVVTKNKIRIR